VDQKADIHIHVSFTYHLLYTHVAYTVNQNVWLTFTRVH